VQFGSFSEGYVFRTVEPGIMVKRLAELYAAQNQVGYVAFTRVGGAVIDPGSHPIVSATIK
jgi:HK97 family phage major capsid protein